MYTPRSSHRLAVLVGLALVWTTLAGCSTPPAAWNGPTAAGRAGAPASARSTTATAPATTATPAPAPVLLLANVADGANNIKVDTVVAVKAAEGSLTKVLLSYTAKDRRGDKVKGSVPGTVSADGARWTADERLEPSAEYTLEMVGKNKSDAATTKARSSFTTQALSLDEQTFPTVYPLPGSNVGVGMPVVLTFDVPVSNHQEFQKHLSVTASPRQAGSWHWYSDREVHFRPQNYWQAGTKVSVEADLNGVSAGGGIYGQNSVSTSFTVARSLVTKINLATKTATVYRDGTLARTIYVSGGKPGFTSRSGHKLIMDKLVQTRMASETIGIAKNSPEAYDLKVKYAMRVTSSGEFLHAAPWNTANFGRVNASHGCIGMSTGDALWLFDQVRIGDPVITTGTARGLEQGNGWTDWDVSYATYQKGSAR